MRLIPNILGNETKSNAERKVFKYLKDVPYEEAYGFHSVGLPVHEKKSYSEADYIVVTRYGVLCLEVKGGQVDCINGVWEFTDRHGKKNSKYEGPFEQATGAMFALKEALIKKAPWVKNVSFATGVVFPDITFAYRGVSIIPEIIYDYSSVDAFEKYIENCHAYWNDRNRKQYNNLTNEEIEELKRIIRDDLHFVPAVGSVADATDQQLVRLTEEQIGVLDALEENDRLLINGPAGTGKTLLALEYARKCINKNEKVLFLTYNKLIADYLSKTNVSNQIVFKHFHGLILSYIPIDSSKCTDKNYYSSVLPDQFLKYLFTHKIMQYDVLIVDEGQDLLNIKYFPIFDKLLKNGLYNGKWIIFYDSNQNLFNKIKYEKAMENLQKYHVVKYKLTKNCRNTESIAMFNKLVSEIDTGNAIVEGERVNIVAYDKDIDGTIDKVINELFADGVKAHDVLFLSPLNYDNSILGSYKGKYKDIIQKFSCDNDTNKICYTTIQSFKGLDSKIVIALDITKDKLDAKNIMLYTLFSRARSLLYVVTDKNTEIELKNKVFMGI